MRSVVLCWLVIDKRGVGEESRETDTIFVLDWPCTYGYSVWLHGTTDMVGVLVGCHGACYILCWLCNGYCHVCLLRYHSTSRWHLCHAVDVAVCFMLLFFLY